MQMNYYLRDLQSRDKNMVLVYYCIQNTASGDQREVKPLSPTPQPNRIRTCRGASALHITLANLAQTGKEEHEVSGTSWIDTEPNELKEEILQDSSHFQLCRSRAARSEFDVVTAKECFLLIFMQAVYKANVNEKSMLFTVLWQNAKFLVPKEQHKPPYLL
ncbi:hypothetical protein BTVI_47518 [Pitangus sulphuratus]|nr:hypothetical protein BTVI_47518 [Pitangus sulphuratus]